MAFLVRRRQVAAKIEAVFGTYNAPAAADLLEPVFDLEWDPEVEMFEREIIRESLSPIAQIPGERSATISFSTELKGSGTAGTAPSHLSVPLRACGMDETIVALTSVEYLPLSTGHESASIEIRETDDTGVCMRKRLAGARGSFSINAEKGQPVIISFEFTGKYFEPDQVAGPLSPSPGFGVTPVSFLGVSFSIHGVGTLLVQQVELDIGNEVSLRNDINDASGNVGALIVARNPTGSLNPEQALIADYNPWSRWTGVSLGMLTYTLNGGAGNTTLIEAPKVQITDVSDGDRDEIRTNELELILTGDPSDDELRIFFT